MSDKFSSNYNPIETNELITAQWFNSDVYHWDDQGDADKAYIIDTPPPGVSGVLHMGHVFSYCQTDFIARYMRMKGKNVFYPIGFDDNGQPSEKLVEKVIGKRFSEMKKDGKVEEFLQKCNEILPEAELEFEKLFKSLGLSYDWRQKYQTISKQSEKMAHLSFEDLYKKGLIYAKNGPVYWDVIDQTALAQADLIDIEKEGVEVRFYFTLDDNKTKLEVMSTRPELLPACVALFYHPQDARYSYLENKTAIVPISNHKVPILPDIDVKMDKGSGLVMCCTYGDIQDKIWIQRHTLQSKVIISKDGKIGDLYAKDAKKQIIEQLKNEGLLIDIKNIKHIVKCGEYSKAPIEIIESQQWYLKTIEFKEDLVEIVKYINFHPSHMKNRLIQWIEGINQDWCISRDRGFGIKIPKHTAFQKDDNESNQVFDTWFTSSITPQLNSLALNNEYKIDIERHKKLYPANLRPQAHEIIRTWAFYTILKAYLHGLSKKEIEQRQEFLNKFENSTSANEKNEYTMDKGTLIRRWLYEEKKFTENEIKNCLIPWQDVMISGWCLAKDGTKMSKSKGNVVTPVELIQEKSADVVRYWSASCSLGVDTAYNETKFADGKRLVNKLWNASKFCHSHFSKLQNIPNVTNITQTFDRWIINKLHHVVNEYDQHFSCYEYSKAKDCVERFFWSDFCDLYLEIVKRRSYDNCLSAFTTLQIINTVILQLFAPFLPYITEAIWQKICSSAKSIHTRGNSVDFKRLFYDIEAAKKGDEMVIIIEAIRKRKAELQLSIKSPIEWRLDYNQFTKEEWYDLQAVCNIINDD